MRCALALAALASGAFSAEPLRERRIELTLRPAGSAYAAEFPAPPVDSTVHVRLAVDGLAADGRVRLNDMALETARIAPGQYDLTGFLNLRGSNTLIVARGGPAKAALLLTPRVYVHEQTVAIRRGRLQASVWIRNTLDNTASVRVEIRLGGPAGPVPDAVVEGHTGISPGGMRELRLEGQIPRGIAGPLQAVTVLEKEEEAMEGAYRFETVSEIASGPPP